MLDISLRHVSAYVNHNSGIKVVQASTKEFCVSRYLHKTSDTAAAFNIGRVIALRCRETGLNRVMWEHKWDRKHKKVMKFSPYLRIKSLIVLVSPIKQFSLVVSHNLVYISTSNNRYY